MVAIPDPIKTVGAKRVDTTMRPGLPSGTWSESATCAETVPKVRRVRSKSAEEGNLVILEPENFVYHNLFLLSLDKEGLPGFCPD